MGPFPVPAIEPARERSLRSQPSSLVASRPWRPEGPTYNGAGLACKPPPGGIYLERFPFPSQAWVMFSDSQFSATVRAVRSHPSLAGSFCFFA